MSKVQLSMPSFVGNTSNQTAPPLCYPSSSLTTKNDNEQQLTLCGCRRAPKLQCLSAIGVLLLVIIYTVMGTILFISLEGDLEEINYVESAEVKPYPKNHDVIYAELRSRTVNQLWSITEDLNVLYKDNWTRLAAQEVKQFQETIMQALKLSRVPNTQQQQQHQHSIPMTKQQHVPYKWTYASAFLYSLTLITTIGYGGVTPRSQWGRLAALLYAVFGIPIILLYLSIMGDGLSSAMRCIFKRLRSTSSKGSNSSSNSNSSSSSTITPTSSTSNNIEIAANKNQKTMETEKHRQFGWNHGKANLHFHNSLHGYGSSYMSNGTGSISMGNHHKKEKQSAVPISICIMILICYITSGAVLFHELQKWGVLESLYFCFTALSTIGFGDLQPKDEIGMYAASAYIIVGMAIVAMCFSLIQTELIIWLRKFAVHEQSTDDEIALVSVAITPIKS